MAVELLQRHLPRLVDTICCDLGLDCIFARLLDYCGSCTAMHSVLAAIGGGDRSDFNYVQKPRKGKSDEDAMSASPGEPGFERETLPMGGQGQST